jgi:hypothetical protein
LCGYERDSASVLAAFDDDDENDNDAKRASARARDFAVREASFDVIIVKRAWCRFDHGLLDVWCMSRGREERGYVCVWRGGMSSRRRREGGYCS